MICEKSPHQYRRPAAQSRPSLKSRALPSPIAGSRLIDSLYLAFLLLLAAWLTTLPARADGFIVPVGRIQPPPTTMPLSVKYHRVEVAIQGVVAQTRVDQVFVNENAHAVEGTYIFPLPEGSALSDFTLISDGKKMAGRLLETAEARRIYEQIVRQQRVPALVEYLGRNLFQASIFPIPARGEQRVQLAYSEILALRAGMHRYVYTLDTERLSRQPLQEVTITVKIQADQPLGSVYSPSHSVSVQRPDPRTAIVSYEEEGTRPDREFVLYYGLAGQDVAMNLLTYRDGEGQDYFLLLAVPRPAPAARSLPKDVLFILDTSGSMAGDKLQQAKNALTYCLNSLNEGDRFNVIVFNSTVEPYRKDMQTVSPAAVKAAIAHVAKLWAEGSTDIDSALRAGLAQFAGKRERPAMIMFLTDGDPTVGETNPTAILKHVQAANSNQVRLFVFGVGFDVNAHFLDKLAADNRGASEFVRPEEQIETAVSALFSKVSHPILTDLRLDVGEIQAFDVFPRRLPDIFKGTQLAILGRYRGPGRPDFRLAGSVQGQEKTYQFGADPVHESTNAFIPRLWAARKIGYLLDEIRLKGQSKELVEEVVALSKRYGIMTEFTSFLAEEEYPVAGGSPPPPAADKAMRQMNQAFGNSSGSWAISQSRNANAMQNQMNAPGNVYLDQEGQQRTVEQVQYAGSKAFYRRKNVWYDGEFGEPKRILKVKQFSPAYFQLLSAFPQVRTYLSLGQEVAFLLKGKAVQIGADGKDTLTRTDLLGLDR